MTYNDADVQRLVKAARSHLQREGWTYGPELAERSDLGHALAPFHPDHETELVEQAAFTLWDYDNSVYDMRGREQETPDKYKRVVRLVIAIARTSGWTPPKH